MKKFFSPNLQFRGRVVRAVLGGLLVIAAIVSYRDHVFAAVTVALAGGFCWFEALRGWCVMRACGIKTRL